MGELGQASWELGELEAAPAGGWTVSCAPTVGKPTASRPKVARQI